MTLYPQTIRSKRTSDAPSSSLVLKRNQFSVFIGTMTQTMDTYSHVLPNLQQQAAERMDEMLG